MFRRYSVLGVYQDRNNSQYQLLEVSYVDGNLQIEERVASNSFEKITSSLNPNYPVLLHLDGDKVVSKKTSHKTGYKNDLIFKASLEDFYFLEYFQELDVFASVIRKDVVKELIDKLLEQGKHITQVTFGPFICLNILKTTNKTIDNIPAPFHSIVLNNKLITSLSRNNNEVNTLSINDETFTNQELPLFASFLQYKFPDNHITISQENIITKNIEEQKYKVLSKIVGVSTLVFFMILLFVGHFILDSKSHKLAETKANSILSQQLISQLESINQEREIKEYVLFSSGINNTDFMTRYIMDIGNSLPNKITINSIDIFPLKKKIRENEKINYELNTLLISGETSSDLEFNNWYESIKSLSWATKISIEDYHKESNFIDSFLIKIKL